MIGRVLRRFVRFCVRRYYRVVAIENPERIPVSGPTLLCANHPNSLIDPILVGMAANRGVHFLAKAPLFNIPVLGSLMYAMGMIPAYRGRDDSSQVRKNLQTLDAATDVLKQGEAVGIFPEGLSHDRIGVEMVRSGAARMAFQAVKDDGGELAVVPIGLNYEDKERFLSDVWIRVGEPIDVNQWRDSNQGHEKHVQRQFTSELDQRLKSIAIHLDDENWEPWLLAIEQITSGIDLPIKDVADCAAPKPLLRRMYIADAMNVFIAKEPERASALGDQIKQLQQNAEGIDVSLDALCRQFGSKRLGSGRDARRIILLLLFTIPAAIGTIQHFVPFHLVRLLSSRYHSKVNRTDVSFYRLLLSIPIYLIAYALFAFLLVLGGHLTIAIVSTLLAPVLGVIAFEYWTALKRFMHDVRQNKRLHANNEAVKSARVRFDELQLAFDDVMQQTQSSHC